MGSINFQPVQGFSEKINLDLYGSIYFPPVQGFSEKNNLDLYGSIYFLPVQGFSEKITLTCVEVSHLIINTHEHYILAPSTNP